MRIENNRPPAGTRLDAPAAPVLIVDDIRTNLLFLAERLGRIGISRVIRCQDSRQVLSILSRTVISLVLLDIRMPNIDGMELLPMMREEFPGVPVIIVTQVSDVKTAVSCMQQGAFDYITKPVDPLLLQATIRRALAFQKLEQENASLKQMAFLEKEVEKPEYFSDIVTSDPAMLRIFRYIEAVATTSEPVLITGETGVGKELMARAVHACSGRGGELVTVNIAGLDDSVFSDALFGHSKGAFTGAETRRPGLIEKASGGTLFLDEIGDLARPSQVKLLRLLQEGEYLPIGDDIARYSNARVVVATNEDVFHLESRGRFRKDLIYRLRTHHIHVPPLRARKEDIPLLVDVFVTEICEKTGRPRPEVARDVFPFLENYRFPGNIRELRAMVTDAVSRNPGALSADNFRHYCRPEDVVGETPEPSPDGSAVVLTGRGLRIPDGEPFPTIRDMTDMLIDSAMERAGGKQTLAARLLGISQPALNKRLKKRKDR